MNSSADLPATNFTEEAVRREEAGSACVQSKCTKLDTVPFGTETHSALVAQSKRCSDPLIQAVYWQDYYHQFEARAHFDNCAFEPSVRYVASLIGAVDKHLISHSKPDLNDVMFTLGQALHAIQDFYAHTDYVERMQKRHAKFGSVPIVPFWTPPGRTDLDKLITGGLVSGRVFWNTPQMCNASVPPHSKLAKDSPNSGRGATATIWPKWTHYDAARRLATEASAAFIEYSFKRWPSLAPYCGSTVIFAVPEDGRPDRDRNN